MSAGQDELWTEGRTAALDARLDPALTSQRDAFSGGRRKLSYLEGHTVIAQLNRLFGYGAWSYSVDEMGTDEYTEGPTEGWYLQCWAVVTLRVGGVSRQDVGCVEVQNTGKGGSVRDNVHNVDSRSTARKGAVTDALKRAARTFGQQLGNGLYDTDDNIYAWMAAHGLEADAQHETLEAEPVLHAGGHAGAGGAEKAQEAPPAQKGDSFTRRASAALRASGARTDGKAEQVSRQRIDPDADLRAEVLHLLTDDPEALDAFQGSGRRLEEMGAAHLRGWRARLLERARKRADDMPRSSVLSQQIAGARSDGDLGAARRAVQDARNAREITEAEWLSLMSEAETRKSALAGPLTAGAAS